jgi:hypothetical protein
LETGESVVVPNESSVRWPLASSVANARFTIKAEEDPGQGVAAGAAGECHAPVEVRVVEAVGGDVVVVGPAGQFRLFHARQLIDHRHGAEDALQRGAGECRGARGAFDQLVRAAAAVDHVLAVAAGERVVARPAQQRVVAVVAVERVGTAVAVQRIVLGASAERVVAVAADEHVGARVAVDDVAQPAAFEPVGAGGECHRAGREVRAGVRAVDVSEVCHGGRHAGRRQPQAEVQVNPGR